MPEKFALTRNKILSELTRSEHGKLDAYLDVGKKAAQNDPEFFAHLIAYDRVKGQIRDAHVALPVISLAVPEYPQELVENSLAHLALLNPRDLLRAYRFVLEVRPKSRHRTIRRMIGLYLHRKEQNHWDRTAIRHRDALHELYALTDTRPMSDRVNIVLFGRKLDKTKAPMPPGSVFEVLRELKNMSAQEAAGSIMKYHIPFLIARGALGEKAKQPDLVLALIGQMSATELVTNSRTLEKLGVKTVPALRAAYEEALLKASTSKKSTFKTARAAEAIEDEAIKAKLSALQEKQIKAIATIEGDWLVLGDRSGSMTEAIEVSRQVAATLAKSVKGNVMLVFFNTTPELMDVTGKSFVEIQERTKFIAANGGTSIGCGLRMALDRNIAIDGIAVVSDAQENNLPFFVTQYNELVQKTGKQVPVYLYRCRSGSAGFGDVDLGYSMRNNGYDLQEFDLRQGTDFYALPNLIMTMRTNRYDLVQEVMDTPLLTLNQVLAEANP